MGLSIESISLSNFRSFSTYEVDGLGGLTIFVGPNAVGKTNIVEAIQLLTAQTSFRHPTVEQLIREGESCARVKAALTGDGRHLELEMNAEDGRKSFLLNGKARRPADLKGMLPSVVFTPDDLDLAKGPMARRRDALDALGCQLSRNHYLIRRDYEKVLQHKNRLLKEEAPQALVDSINDMIVTCGSQLCAYRCALIRRLEPEMKECYRRISDGREQLDICYVPSWESSSEEERLHVAVGKEEARESMAKALAARAGDERARKRSLVGPHLDRINFFLDGRSVNVYASQGQQRSVVLAFKLAESHVIFDMLSQKPVMLLDDVMSELDSSRRRAFVDFVLGGEQTIVTTTNLGYFDENLVSMAQVVDLSGGAPRHEAIG